MRPRTRLETMKLGKDPVMKAIIDALYRPPVDLSKLVPFTVTAEKVTIDRDLHITGQITATKEITAWMAGAVAPEVFSALSATAPLYKPASSSIGLKYNAAQLEVNALNELQIKAGVLTPADHDHAMADVTGLVDALAAKAAIASPIFTGTPTVPTPDTLDNSTRIASTAFVRSVVAALVDSSPASLDTLNELATALGNDPNFATTMINSLASKAPLANPVFTGTVGGITKAMVGLGNVDNTSDADKPVSTAQNTAISAVQTNLNNHAGLTNNPHGVTKAQLGLGSVDNTSDANKPVSTATATALGLKVDKVAGKSLVYDTDIAKLAAFAVEAGKVTIDRDLYVSGNISASKEVVAYVAGAVTSDVLSSLSAVGPLYKPSALSVGLAYNINQFEVNGFQELQIKAGILAPAAHSHAISDVLGLQGALDGKLSLSGGTISGNLIVPYLSSNFISSTTYSDGHITWGAAQINRPTGYVELQYDNIQGVRINGLSSNPIILQGGDIYASRIRLSQGAFANSILSGDADGNVSHKTPYQLGIARQKPSYYTGDLNSAQYIAGINDYGVVKFSANTRTNTPTSSDWWHVSEYYHDGDNWKAQIALDYFSDEMYFRRQYANSWQPWRTVWHTGNFNPDTKANNDHTHKSIFSEGTNSSNDFNADFAWDQLRIIQKIDIPRNTGTAPDAYGYGQTISSGAGNSKFQLYANHISSSGDGLRYRSGWGDDYKPWQKIWDSGNLANPIQGSGTAGTIPKFGVGGTSIGNSIMSEDGTSLTINGAININCTASIYNVLDGVYKAYYGYSASQGGIQMYNFASGQNFMMHDSGNASIIGGKFGINTTNPIQTLTVKSHSNGWDGGLSLVSQDETLRYNFHPDNNGVLYMGKNAGEGTFFFHGTVGIGTTNPSHNLQIGSDPYYSIGLNTSTIFPKVYLGGLGSYIGYDHLGEERMVFNSRWAASHYEFKIGDSEVMRIKSGLVGINTTNPDAPLTVRGKYPGADIEIARLGGTESSLILRDLNSGYIKFQVEDHDGTVGKVDVMELRPDREVYFYGNVFAPTAKFTTGAGNGKIATSDAYGNLLWKSTSELDFEGNFKTTIDASGLDQSIYYPVTIGVPASRNVKISVIVSLNSGTVPSWSTHPNGFSCNFSEIVNGNGWGTTPINRTVFVDDYLFSNVRVIGGVTQMGNSNTEVIYVRGGGKYFFYTSMPDITPILRTGVYTINSQSVEPTSNALNIPIKQGTGSGLGVSKLYSSSSIESSGDIIAPTAKLQSLAIKDASGNIIWTVELSGTDVVFKNSEGVKKMKLEQTGNLLASGEVSAYSQI